MINIWQALALQANIILSKMKLAREKQSSLLCLAVIEDKKSFTTFDNSGASKQNLLHW
jgi:hypothetical protein